MFKTSSKQAVSSRLALGLGGVVMTVLASMPAHGADAGWVSTATKAFSAGRSARTLAVQADAPAGTAVSIAVGLKSRDAVGLDSYIATLGRPGAKPLTSRDVVNRFAPTREQAEAVAAHLRSAGFVNVRIAPNRLLVTADGSAATVRTAFRTALKTTVVNGESRLFNASDAQVPAALGNTVLGVLGLQTAHTMKTHSRSLGKVSLDQARPFAAAGVAEWHLPSAFPGIYSIGDTPTASKTTVGIITAGDITQTLIDLDAFTTRFGFPQVNYNVITAGPTGNSTAGTEEWNMDSQTIVGASGGNLKALNFYVAYSMGNYAIAQAYNQAVIDNEARVINVSLGECEDWTVQDGSQAVDDQIFKFALAQGQTFAVSTGDSGSDECGDGGVHQSYPAVSPYVVAVGGTTLLSQNRKVWAGESVWNHDGSGTGGGISFTEAIPAWQSALPGAGKMRAVPDISFDGDPSSGVLVMINGNFYLIGGTSLSAPIFSAFWARLQTANNNQLGFPLPALYALAPKHPELFHDVTEGSNGAFSAAPGWDAASGWGSVNIGKLNALIKSTPGHW